MPVFLIKDRGPDDDWPEVFEYLLDDQTANVYTTNEAGERNRSLLIVDNSDAQTVEVFDVPEPDSTLTRDALEAEAHDDNKIRVIDYGKKALIAMEDVDDGKYQLVIQHWGASIEGGQSWFASPPE